MPDFWQKRKSETLISHGTNRFQYLFDSGPITPGEIHQISAVLQVTDPSFDILSEGLFVAADFLSLVERSRGAYY